MGNGLLTLVDGMNAARDGGIAVVRGGVVVLTATLLRSLLAKLSNSAITRSVLSRNCCSSW